jgi:hypothetical protein
MDISKIRRRLEITYGQAGGFKNKSWILEGDPQAQFENLLNAKNTGNHAFMINATLGEQAIVSLGGMLYATLEPV